jgi:hypothetical protein
MLGNFLSVPLLFFLLGILAVFLKSDLEIPQPLPKFFSLFLLISIGLQGGYRLYKGGFSLHVLLVFFAGILLAIFITLYTFFILKLRLDTYNASAIATSYGATLSPVVFISAGNLLDHIGVHYGGYMVAMLVLMESPAIILGLFLVSLFEGKKEKLSWGEIFRDAFLNGSVFLLIGTLVVGYLVGERGWKAMEPMFGNLFMPMLAFFLLDMGLVSARQMETIKPLAKRKLGYFLVAFAIFIPIVNAIIGALLAKLLGFNKGDAYMLSVLCASASYVAVPATFRISLPEANPSIYLTMSLGFTFPFNLIFGVPLYYSIINFIWG